MKNHKGSIPALLTLGLVLIGSLVTIGVSYLTNTNKIASNPKAAEKTCTTGFYANKEESYPGNGDGCNAVCGTDCEECKWAGETKYQCKSAADGSDVNVPACTKARTYASKKNCVNEHLKDNGDKLCSQCLLGQTNRVEYDGKGPPAGGSEKRTGKLNELCLISETEAGTDYYCPGAGLKCSFQNDKGRCVEDEGSAKAPREGCKQIIVKGKITSKQQNDCSSQKINGISKKVEYKDGRYWCCEGVNSDDVDIKCDDPRYCVDTSGITYVKGEQSLNGNKLTQYFADNNDCSSWNNGKNNKNEICLPPAEVPTADDPNSICQDTYPGTDTYCITGFFDNLCRAGYDKKRDGPTCFTAAFGLEKKCCVKSVENDGKIEDPNIPADGGVGGNFPADEGMANMEICERIQCPQGFTGEYYMSSEIFASERYYTTKKICMENDKQNVYDEEGIKIVACWSSASSNTGETQTAQSDIVSTVIDAGADCLLTNTKVLFGSALNIKLSDIAIVCGTNKLLKM